MVFAALLYAGIGSVLTYFVGRPIVGGECPPECKPRADYRFALVRLRENSEAVALIRGEPDEKRVLTGYFGASLASTIGLMRTQRRLMWLTSFYAMRRLGLPDPGRQPALLRRRHHAWAC